MTTLIAILIIIPLAIVATLDPYWQLRILIAVVSAYLLWIAASFLAYLRSRSAKPRLRRGPAWHHRQEAIDFQLRFLEYVTEIGGKVISSRILSPECASFAVQRGKQTVVFLCFAPNGVQRPSDLDQLDRDMAAQHAAGCIVTAKPADRPEEPVAGPARQRIVYQNLSNEALVDRLFAPPAARAA